MEVNTTLDGMGPRRSVLAMAVLSMLTEEPMHAYRMQQLIRERHKDDVVNVSQRTSVYQTVERLLRDGQVEVEGTDRAEGRPERTTYRITDDGRTTLTAWLTEMLASPAGEFPEFPAALSFMATLRKTDVRAALETRLEAQRAALAKLTEETTQARTWLPAVFLVENDFQLAVLTAEVTYLEQLVTDFDAGVVDWPDR